ncbi:exosortase A, partial [Thiospirillum jenense]
MSISVSDKTYRNNNVINPILRWVWFAIALLTLILTYHQTFISILNIWSRSDTFAHGFFVVPIVIFLIRKQRVILSQTVLKTEPIALVALLLFSGMWLIGHALTIVVVEQFAVVALIPILVWFIFGSKVLNVLAFPLGFLFFTVPIGEELVYPLMQVTAFFTVTLLKLTNIPVYSDGTFFSIPSGDWSVVAACSGIRYLIASTFLGVLYAYFFYRAWWRRGLFVLLSI